MPGRPNRVTDELIELNGLRFHFRDWESAKPGAPSVVLLHGFSGHSRVWDPTARLLAEDYRVLALDQRGHGESAWDPARGYTPEQYAEDVAAFAAALGLSNFVLVGLSMGGTAAIAYAGRRPPVLERLVIVDIGPELSDAGLDRILASLIQAPDEFESPEVLIERMLAANPNADPEAVRHRARYNAVRTADGRWTWRWDRALRDEQVARRTMLDPAEGWRLVANIGVPTLLVRGEHSDILAPEVASRMVETIPDCRLLEVAGAGHTVPYDRFEGFMDALRTFV